MALFSEIIGQEHIKEHLQEAIVSRMASHAYIIQGEEGMGKKMIAKTFASGLLCERGEAEPCLNCHACKQVLSGNHPDVRVLIPEKPNVIKVDEVRQQIINDVGIKPYSGDYKIYIIPDAQRMNTQAMNALLKTLEEPPAYVVILMLCTSASLLLDTIVSRCVMLNVRPLEDVKVRDYLMKSLQIPDYKASVISAFARGSIGRAVSLASDEEFDTLREIVTDIFKNIKSSDPTYIRDLIARILELNMPPEEFLDYLTLWFRDILVYKSTGKDNRLLFKEDVRSLAEMSGKTSYEGIERVLKEISDAKSRLRVNVNKDLVLELVLLEIKES